MSDALTPMMRQYRCLKAGLPPGVLLLFRLGDFYELFFEDAIEAAPILGVALTRRQQAPMCGVPYHAVESYVAKLIAAGFKVALCDQMEEPGPGKRLVRRDITRIITPGTVTEDPLLSRSRPHYLAGVCPAAGVFGVALLDLSTGAFELEEVPEATTLRDLLRREAPGECVIPERHHQDAWITEALGTEILRTSCEDWVFEYEAAYERLTRHLAVPSLEGFGCEGRRAAVGAAGGVLYYVQDQLRRTVTHVRSLRLRVSGDHLVLDEASCCHLDLVPLRGRDPAGTLLHVLDVTRTPMGGRRLRDWLLRPLCRPEAIEARLDAVEAVCRDRATLREVVERLGCIRDLERLLGRLSAGTGNARDALALAQSLEVLPGLKAVLSALPAARWQAIAAELGDFSALCEQIGRALVDEPPVSLKEGGLIRDGYDCELDALRRAATEGRQWLATYQQQEQERTGIRNLKVRYNQVFGYYIEVSKGQLGRVPADYQRKQTLVQAERFITPELKEYEHRILGAQERAAALECELFERLRQTILAETGRIQAAASAVAEADVLAALADRALAFRYSRPRITPGDRIYIREGRHPVVEQMPEAERFVPNDTLLDLSDHQILILTGPNMAGKSTYIRQVALIVILAQMGSFVPATEAEIGLVDRIFTRVGASDDLARGRSTFMIEMQETANILHNATPRSLIVLDEIGRGTSTFDGISIAWAVAEYLHNQPRVRARTLFATHYHELTDLALVLPRVTNLTVLVRERGDSIVFLRRIVPGAADKSYGIQVARLAGLPPEVIERAQEILANLEEGEIGESGQPKIAQPRRRRDTNHPQQLRLF